MTSTNNLDRPAVVAFAFEVSAREVDGFWYASSPVQSPRLAAVGSSADDAIRAWVELFDAGQLV